MYACACTCRYLYIIMQLLLLYNRVHLAIMGKYFVSYSLVQLELSSKCLRKIVVVLSMIFTNWWTLMSIKPRSWKFLIA